VSAGSASIRDAESGDAAAIAQVHVASWRWAYEGQLPAETLDGLDVDEREHHWQRAIAGSTEVVIVAEEDGSIVGFASAGSSNDDDATPSTGELSAIYLVERAAGRGIGRVLLERATEQLRARGFARATLWVLETNTRARRFYEGAGWVFDGTRSTHQVQCENRPIVRYSRSL
jgi:ribosomal protein S18 acetylase RimI-like enzyme